jgi:hypothetical protein
MIEFVLALLNHFQAIVIFCHDEQVGDIIYHQSAILSHLGLLDILTLCLVLMLNSQIQRLWSYCGKGRNMRRLFVIELSWLNKPRLFALKSLVLLGLINESLDIWCFLDCHTLLRL